MEQNKKRKPPGISDKEIQVCKILLNLSNLIVKSDSNDEEIVWGGKQKRSSIGLRPSPRHLESLAKKPRIISTPGSSPTTTFSISATECDNKTQYFSEEIPENMRQKEELKKKRNILVETRESLSTEYERVKAYHSKLEVYNKLLKAKKEEVQINRKSEFKSDLSDLYKRFNVTPLPQLLEKINQNKHSHCNQTPATSSRLPLPDLNDPCDEVSQVLHLQPLDRTEVRRDI